MLTLPPNKSYGTPGRIDLKRASTSSHLNESLLRTGQLARLPTGHIHSVGMMLLFSFVRLGLGLVHRAVRVVWR
jgi:hypothetical protein